MADTRLEDLTDIATASGVQATDIFYINRPGTDADYKGDADDITTYVLNNIPLNSISVGALDVSADVAALLDDANFAAMRTTLGLGTVDSPEFTAINLGHASNTTITRVSAGVIAVEGSNVILASNAADASGINTGTSTTTFATPDAIAGSYAGTKTASFSAPPSFALVVGDGAGMVKIPASLNGMNLVSVNAEVASAPSGGTVLLQLRRDRGSVDMLSTRISIDDGETGSDTAATPAVINGSNDDVATNDVIYLDVDAANGADGLHVVMEFRLP